MSETGIFRPLVLLLSLVLVLPVCLLAAIKKPPPPIVNRPAGAPPIKPASRPVTMPASQPSTQPTSQPESQPAEDPNSIAAEEGRFEATFGKRFRAVQETPIEDDDRTFANELLLETESQLLAKSFNKAYVLAHKIIELTAALTDEKSAGMARRAIAIQVKTRELSPTDEVMLWRENAMARLETAKTKQKNGTPLARMAAEACLDYAQVMLKEPEAIQAVRDAVDASLALVNEYKLTDLAARAGQFRIMMQEIKTRQEQIAATNQKLAAVADNPSQSLALKRELGELYLKNGNIAAAAKSFLGTGDHREAAMTTAATFLANSGAVPAAFPPAIEKLASLAKLYNEPARSILASCGQKMCEAYMDSDPPPDKIAAVTQLQIQLEAITGVHTKSELAEQLQGRYGPLAGRIDTFGGKRVRLTYDFSKDEQLKDWPRRDEGQWGITGGVLACKPKPSSTATIGQKVYFLADQPWKIQFTGSARVSFGASFLDPNAGTYACRFTFERGSLRLASFNFSGADSNLRLQPGAVYKVTLEFDGSKFKCTINGREVLTKENIKPSKARAHLLLSCEHSNVAPTAFDDVVIEGTPALESPPPAK